MKEKNYTNDRMRAAMWVVNKLLIHGKLTRPQFEEMWKEDKAISDGNPLQRRTLYNYMQTATTFLGVLIECDKRDGSNYKITCQGDNVMAKWLMRNYAASDAVLNSDDIRSRVLLEEIPSGQEYLNQLMEAMRTNRKITFDYQRFDEKTDHTISMAEPYCVKLYKQRWYVLVKEYRTLLVSHKKKVEMNIYSLDRMLTLKIEKEGFKMDEAFDAESYFKYAFGVRVERGSEPCRVLLKVASKQAPYLRKLPWHASQEEIETHEEYSIFQYNVALSIELYFQILKYGSLVEVIAPEDLRDVIVCEVHRIAEMYGLVEPASPEEVESWIEEMRRNHPEVLEQKLSADVYRGMK